MEGLVRGEAELCLQRDNVIGLQGWGTSQVKKVAAVGLTYEIHELRVYPEPWSRNRW